MLLFYGLKLVFIVALLQSQKKKNLNKGRIFKKTPQQPACHTFYAAF